MPRDEFACAAPRVRISVRKPAASTGEEPGFRIRVELASERDHSPLEVRHVLQHVLEEAPGGGTAPPV
jgi:hypothetical protein